MRPGRVLILFALAVFAGGALIAPWLFWLAQWAAAHSAAFESLARQPFRRYVDRSLLVLALAGLWPLLRALGMNSWRALGWAPPRGQGARLAAGFTAGLVSLALVGLIALLTGAWQFNPDLSASRLSGKILGAVLTAVVVAVLEETLFRGAFMGALRRAHSVGVAVVVSSALYALLHFFQKPEPPDAVHWFTGLELLPRMMRGFVDGPTLLPGFLNLTLVGIILALAYQRTGNLYFSVGLHGGWIFWLKFWGAMAGVAPGANAWLWGSTSKVYDGWLTLAVLAAVLVILERWWWRKIPRDEAVSMDKTH